MATDNATAAGNDAIFSLEQMRGAYEHRALWLHYLAEKAVEDGENGPLHQAIRKCGLYHADVRFAPFTSMDDFDEVFQSEPAKSVFEMETIEKDEDTLSIDFHYCPLVEAWKKLGLPHAPVSSSVPFEVRRAAPSASQRRTRRTPVAVSLFRPSKMRSCGRACSGFASCCFMAHPSPFLSSYAGRSLLMPFYRNFQK